MTLRMRSGPKPMRVQQQFVESYGQIVGAMLAEDSSPAHQIFNR